jgi:WD40 repeat protein
MNVRSYVGLAFVLLLGLSQTVAQTPSHVEIVPQTGHTAGVTAVAFRPEADQVFTASSDGTAILWDANSGHALRTYKGGPLSNSFVTATELQEAKMLPTFPLGAKEPPAVAAVEFTPDGRTFVMACRPEGFLASMNANSQAIVWDVVSGKRLRVFDLEPDASAIALSPNGKQLLSAGQPMGPDEAKEMVEMGAKVKQSTGVILWDIVTGKEIRQFGGYDVSYEAVQFSRDSRYVLAGGSDLMASSAATIAPAPMPPPEPNSAAPPAPAPIAQSTAQVPEPELPAEAKPAGVLNVWDAATGDQVLKLQPQQGVMKAAFSPSGQYILTVDAGDKLDVWDVKTQKRVLTAAAKTGVFSADGKQLVTVTSTGLFSILDLASGKEARSFNVCLDGVKCLAPSADGKRLLVGMTHLVPPRPQSEAAKQPCPRGEAVLIDLSDGRVLNSLAERTDAPGFVAVSPKGQQLLVGDGLWDTTSGQKLANLCNKPMEVFSAAFSPDGKRALVANHRGRAFLSGMFDGLFGQSSEELASLVEIPTGKELAKFEAKQRIEDRVALSFTPDGKRALLATRSGAISLWDVAKAKKLAESQIPCNNLAAAFSPDGKLAAVSFHEEKTMWWDREKGEAVSEKDREKAPPPRPGTPPRTTSDGKLQITMAEDTLGVVVQEVADPNKSQTLKANLTPYESIRAMGFDARDERFVYAEISSPFAGLWDVDAGKKLREFSLDEPFSAEVMAFLPDGKRVASAGDDGQVTIWETATGKKASTIKLESPIMAIALSADGTLVAAGCADRTAVVAQVVSGEKTVLRGHEGPVDAVVFRPDGKLLVTASREDGTARLWDVANGKELARIISVGNRKDWLIFTLDGLYDGSEGGRKLVAFRVSKGLEVQPAEQFSAEFYQPRPGLLGKIWGGK